MSVSSQTGYRGSGHPGELVDRNPGAVGRIPSDPKPEGWRLKVTALVWSVAWEIARKLPERLVLAVADLAARAGYRLKPATAARVRSNFSRVVEPEVLEATVREAYRSYARYWIEAFRAADLPATEVDARTATEGVEHLDAALERGCGVIILLAHHGSWDTAARWGETHGYHLAVVAEVVRPLALFRKFVALREAIGLEVVPLQKGSPMTARLAEVLASNHLVGLLTDRDLTGTAPVVKFFGEDARMPAGAVVLSRRTQAPILPATLRQEPGRRWRLQIMPPVAVDDVSLAEGTQRVAHAIEDLIRTAPAQWHAFSPVWLADLPAHRRGDWQEPAAE